MIQSIAYLSMHTSPLAQPGTGYAGGMNVYVNELSETMAKRNIEVVVFTRRSHPDQPTVVTQRPGYRVVHVEAGAPEDLRVDLLPGHVVEFSERVVSWAKRNTPGFDIVHSHYWLSGWGGVLVKEALGAPLVNSFHTLGRVKDSVRRPGEPPVTPIRTLTEDEVLARSDAVVASTPREVSDLMNYYGADRRRIHISPPGLDHVVFSPGDRERSRTWLGLGNEPIVLFAGRIEAHKGVDVAIGALAKLPERVAAGEGPPRLLVVGGPSGKRGEHELRLLHNMARELDVVDRIQFVPAQPHAMLADYYRAADVLIMPSRDESFGLVAVEAQACGLPVVASDAGGLRHVIDTGGSGTIVDSLEPAAFAEATLALLDDTARSAAFGRHAIATAARFSWQTTAHRMHDLYAAAAEM